MGNNAPVKETRRIAVVVAPDPKDGGYVVEGPSLPGAVDQGETV
jgi:predicted RNase H-like HicB family nuclease